MCGPPLCGPPTSAGSTRPSTTPWPERKQGSLELFLAELLEARSGGLAATVETVPQWADYGAAVAAAVVATARTYATVRLKWADGSLKRAESRKILEYKAHAAPVSTKLLTAEMSD